MGGEKTVDNCYGLSSDPQITCDKATIDTGELWHQHLGHLNYNDPVKVANRGAIVIVIVEEGWIPHFKISWFKCQKGVSLGEPSLFFS